MKRSVAAGLTVCAMTVLACAVARAGDPVTIIQNGRAFHPAEITVDRGTTINFSNQDEFLHQIYVDVTGFNYDSAEQPPGETLHISFPDGGTFPVRCHIHPKMLLIVHVK